MKCPQCNGEIKVYRNPTPTVDIIIDVGGQVVLIERKNPPYGWALPGGFVDYGESLEAAAAREAEEETGIKVKELKQFRCYSDPARDARQHTVTTVFTAFGEKKPVAGDDAKGAGLFALDNLPDLVFDHEEILSDYIDYKRTGERRR